MNLTFGQKKLVALAGIFLLMLNAGCSRTPAGSIEHVLGECNRIGRDASALRNPAASASYTADHFQALDTSDCPPDFRAAFQEHINAWRQAQTAYAENTMGNNVLSGAIAAVTENPSMIGAPVGAAVQAQQNINATYYQLATIAAADGARVPQPVVQ